MVASPEPPRYGPRPKRSSKIEQGEIRAPLAEDPRVSSQRLREICIELGYAGGKTIFDERVRELRPLYLTQRTVYRPGELVQVLSKRFTDIAWGMCAAEIGAQRDEVSAERSTHRTGYRPRLAER